MRENVWIAERKEVYAKRKQEIPPPQDLAGSFAEARAARLTTLGVTAALGEMAAQSGDDDKAMDYLASARFSGHAPGTADQIFEALYKKSHNGTLDGLEAMLNTEYHKRFPNPVRLEAYKPTEKRSICNQFDGQEFECDSVSSSVGKGRRLPLLQLPSRVHRPHLFHCVAA